MRKAVVLLVFILNASIATAGVVPCLSDDGVCRDSFPIIEIILVLAGVLSWGGSVIRGTAQLGPFMITFGVIGLSLLSFGNSSGRILGWVVLGAAAIVAKLRSANPSKENCASRSEPVTLEDPPKTPGNTLALYKATDKSANVCPQCAAEFNPAVFQACPVCGYTIHALGQQSNSRIVWCPKCAKRALIRVDHKQCVTCSNCGVLYEVDQQGLCRLDSPPSAPGIAEHIAHPNE